MPAPIVSDYGQRLYDRLEPIAAEDETLGWPLLTYVGALGSIHEVIDELTSDSEERVGWSALFDPQTCPASMLRYLAQYPGVRIPIGVSEQTARDMISEPAGWRRGSRGAVLAALRPTLEGQQLVSFIERQEGSFWRWLITTRTDETPNYDRSLAAILSQKRAGVVLTYIVTDDVLIDELGVGEGSGSGDLEIDELGSGDIDDL